MFAASIADLPSRVVEALGDPAARVDRCVSNPYAATFTSEVIDYRAGDGSVRRLLCKYGGRHPDNPTGDHGSVAYEARVYRELLVPMNISPLRFLGTSEDGHSGVTFLLMEYLDQAVHADAAADPRAALGEAARWIGRFHSAAAPRVDQAASFLVRGEASAVRASASRALECSRSRGRAPIWLERISAGSAERLAMLASRPVTIVHGDYYTDNVLVADNAVHPIDWGWTSIGPGESDLAALTEGWPDDVVLECRRRYVEARWPEHADAGFDEAFIAARLHQIFRWLGHRSDWVGTPKWERRLERLHRLSEQIGLI